MSSGVMVSSGIDLLLRATSGSVALQWLGSGVMSVAPVTTKASTDAPGFSYLKP